jgi:hypothetical protein
MKAAVVITFIPHSLTIVVTRILPPTAYQMVSWRNIPITLKMPGLIRAGQSILAPAHGQLLIHLYKRREQIVIKCAGEKNNEVHDHLERTSAGHAQRV